MARNWAKIAANLDWNPKVREGGNLARQVFELALRRNAELDLGGRIPRSHLRPGYLAEALMLDRLARELCPGDGVTACHGPSGTDLAASGVARAVSVGLLSEQDDHYVIVGWDDEWGKRPLSEAERKRKQRANARNPLHAPRSHDLSVTERDSPDCHRSEEKRGEEKREDERRGDPIGDRARAAPGGGSPVVATSPARARKPKPDRATRAHAMPGAWEPRGDELALARSLGVDPAREAEAFRDHHGAKGTRFVDWDAAFRNWLRNAVKFGRGGGGSASGGRAGPSFFEIIDALSVTPRPPEVPS